MCDSISVFCAMSGFLPKFVCVHFDCAHRRRIFSPLEFAAVNRLDYLRPTSLYLESRSTGAEKFPIPFRTLVSFARIRPCRSQVVFLSDGLLPRNTNANSQQPTQRKIVQLLSFNGTHSKLLKSNEFRVFWECKSEQAVEHGIKNARKATEFLDFVVTTNAYFHVGIGLNRWYSCNGLLYTLTH